MISFAGSFSFFSERELSWLGREERNRAAIRDLYFGGERVGGGSGVNQRANGCKSCCWFGGWMWMERVRTEGKNLPPWTRVPSVAVVQQSERAKEQQRQRQPSQDSLNRTPPSFLLRQGREEREREEGGRRRRKEKEKKQW